MLIRCLPLPTRMIGKTWANNCSAQDRAVARSPLLRQRPMWARRMAGAPFPNRADRRRRAQPVAFIPSRERGRGTDDVTEIRSRLRLEQVRKRRPIAIQFGIGYSRLSISIQRAVARQVLPRRGASEKLRTGAGQGSEARVTRMIGSKPRQSVQRARIAALDRVRHRLRA